MVFRDYRRPIRREGDRGRRRERRDRTEGFRFQYQPMYELYRDRWRGEDTEPDWQRRARADRFSENRDFRFQYEPVEEIYRNRRAAQPRGSESLRDRRPDARAGLEEWQIEGPFTGFGPSGYRRSDERIREEVYERLAMSGRLDATQIKVNVQNGEITLTGTVKDRWSKRMAEDSVEEILGVQQVTNHLRVREVEEEDRTRGYWGPTAGLGGRLREGMDVIGRDGDFIGTVKRVRVNDFLLDRPWARDVYVPFDAIRRLHNRVELNVVADEVGEEDWARPGLF